MRALVLTALCVWLCVPVLAGHPFDPEVDKILRKTRSDAGAGPEQAAAMADLIWPAEGDPDPLVAAGALNDLIAFGHNALTALRAKIRSVPPHWSADATAALIQARWKRAGGDPPDYLPGLVDALWNGSVEAQRIAMLEVSRAMFPAALLPIIDAAKDHPELTGPAIAALGQMGDSRARFFLHEMLRTSEPRFRRDAAFALSALGAGGLGFLRDGAASEDADVRLPAIEALLPHTTTNDLTQLYEYPDRFADDPADLLERVRQRASALEVEYQQLLDAEAASGAP